MVSGPSCTPTKYQTFLYDYLNSTLLLAFPEIRKQTQKFRNVPRLETLHMKEAACL